MNNSLLFVASFAFILSTLHQVVSLPAGIKAIMNHELSKKMLLCIHVAGVLMYIGWSVYGFMLRDVAILFGCGMGVLSSAILLGYTFWLRKAK